MERREMGDIVGMYLLSKRIHNFSKLHRVTVIFGQVFFKENENE